MGSRRAESTYIYNVNKLRDVCELGILQLSTSPVSCYPGYAAALSIILQERRGQLWYHENFLDLCCMYKSNTNSLLCDYLLTNEVILSSRNLCQPENLSVPLLQCYSVPREAVFMYQDPIEWFKEIINNGYYIYMYINRGSLSQYTDEYTHIAFFYGYDEEKKEFRFCDYIGGKYKKLVCTQDEFINSVITARDMDIAENGPFHLKSVTNKINLLKINNEYSYEFSLESLYMNMKKYMNAERNENGMRYKIFINDDTSGIQKQFGIMHYESYIRYIYLCSNNKAQIDNRVIQFFVDHKMVLIDKIMFLGNEYGIRLKEDDIRQLQKNANRLLMITLKYNLSGGEEDLFVKAYDYFNNCKEMEEKLIGDILRWL